MSWLKEGWMLSFLFTSIKFLSPSVICPPCEVWKYIEVKTEVLAFHVWQHILFYSYNVCVLYNIHSFSVYHWHHWCILFTDSWRGCREMRMFQQLCWLMIFVGLSHSCPNPDTILPCQCANHGEEIQIWLVNIRLINNTIKCK